MPVQAVLPADPTATTTPPGTTTTVEPGFAAVLDAQTGGSAATASTALTTSTAPTAATAPTTSTAATAATATTPTAPTTPTTPTAPTAPTTPDARTPGTIPADPTAATPGGTTGAVTRSHGNSLAQLRTVSLGVMVGAMAGGPSASVGAAMGGPPAAAAGAKTAAVSDAWGASSARPAGAAGAGQAVLDAGERYLGVPYKWGGTSAATGFDCSGFTQQVYEDLGIKLPRVSVDQSKAGTEVPGGLSGAQVGDLVFWKGDGSRPNHIGIYAGEGRMLVAPRTGDVVKYQEITRTPDAVRRVL